MDGMKRVSWLSDVTLSGFHRVPCGNRQVDGNGVGSWCNNEEGFVLGVQMILPSWVVNGVITDIWVSFGVDQYSVQALQGYLVL